MSRTNPLRAALENGQVVAGPFSLFTDPAATEIVLGAGFDFILIDGEHRALNPETVETLCRAAQGLGKAAMVRVPMLTRGALQYALDAGADAVLVPLVGNAAQAREVADLTHYPPQGSRGLNSATRAGAWGPPDPVAYPREANRDAVVAIQIETTEGLENLDAIAAVEGIDMLFVGPGDLSHNLGLTLQFNHLEVRAAISRVFQAGRRNNKWLGVLAPDEAFGKWCVGQGVTFLAYRSDVRFLTAAAKAACDEARRITS